MRTLPRHLMAACFLGALAPSCIIPVPVTERPESPDGNATAFEDEWHGHFSLPLGMHKGSDDFDDAADQFNFGLFDFDIQPPGFPVSIVIQGLFSYSDDGPDGILYNDVDYTLASQFNLGIRKVWQKDRWQPFVGGGVSFVDVSLYEDDTDYYYYSDDDTVDSESDFGYWVGAGAYYAPAPGFTMGLTAQYVFDAEVDLVGSEFDAGGLDVLLLLGVGW